MPWQHTGQLMFEQLLFCATLHFLVLCHLCRSRCHFWHFHQIFGSLLLPSVSIFDSYTLHLHDVFETQLLDQLQLRPKAAMGAAEGPHGWFGLCHSGAAAETRYFVAFHSASWQPSPSKAIKHYQSSTTITGHQCPSKGITRHLSMTSSL